MWFSLEKFRPYLVGSKIIFFTNHAITIHVGKEIKDTKPRLIDDYLSLTLLFTKKFSTNNCVLV